MPLQALLGMDPEPLGPNGKNKFFFASPLLAQRLAILKKMVNGRSAVIVVMGEPGSGKTTLINQFMADAGHDWRANRIRLKPKHRRADTLSHHLNNRRVFVSTQKNLPSMIIDDAHQLSVREMKLLFQWAFSHNGHGKLNSVILLAGPQLRKRYTEIAAYLPPNSVIDKIHMAPFTEKQTAAYLHHRIMASGYAKAIPFSENQIRAIHHLSNGLPGWINGEAYKVLKEMSRSVSNNSTLRRWGKALPWKKKLLDKISKFSKN
jgi:type II secretory pathway predicted ATPase ExeA